MALLSRKEMDPKFQWDLKDIYPSVAAWEEAYKAAREAVKELSSLSGTLGESKEALKEGLDKIYAVTEPVELIYLYAMLMKSGDNSDPEAQALEGKAMNLYVALQTALSFVDPEILAIPEETLNAWMADPLLGEYRHILEDTARMRPHTLSAKEHIIKDLYLL